MAYLDQYIVNNTDRTLRLVSALDAGRSALPVVRVGSREFQRYVDLGYRMYNPYHRNAALGLHRIVQMTLPGYAMANELVGGHGSHSRNLAAKRRSNPDDDPIVPGYTTWDAAQAMKKKARELGSPELVKLVPESTASEAARLMKAAQDRGRISHRYTMNVFVVTDRRALHGYAPASWIDETYDEIREVEDKAQEKKVDQMIAKTEALKEKVLSQVEKQSVEIQKKLDPEVEKVVKAIEALEKEVETKGPDSPGINKKELALELALAALQVSWVGAKAVGRMTVGAVKGFAKGWEGEETGFSRKRGLRPFHAKGVKTKPKPVNTKPKPVKSWRRKAK